MTLSTELSKVVNEKLDEPIPKSCTQLMCNKKVTYKDVLNALSGKENNYDVYIFGGAIRDLVHTGNKKELNDIDINFTMPFDEVTNVLDRLRIKHEVKEDKKYIVAGDKTHDEYLEGFFLYPDKYELCGLESAANSLLLDVNTMKIMDLTGKGYADAGPNNGAQTYRIPCDDHDKWLNHKDNPKTLWRMLKFRNRNYTVPEEDKTSIYKHWLTTDDKNLKWDKAWKVLKRKDSKNIVDFIIKDLGEIDFTNTEILQFFEKLFKYNVFDSKQEEIIKKEISHYEQYKMLYTVIVTIILNFIFHKIYMKLVKTKSKKKKS